MNIEQAAEVLGDNFKAILPDATSTIDALGLPEGASILDVGTGQGNCAICLALHGHTVVTGEPDFDDTVYAKQNWEDRAEQAGVKDRIRFEAFSADDMPFGDNAFDAVFFFGVLHHIDADRRQKSFEEAARVTKEAGSVVFFEPSAKTLVRVREWQPDHPDPSNPDDYLGGLNLAKTTRQGQMMDIYCYRRNGG